MSSQLCGLRLVVLAAACVLTTWATAGAETVLVDFEAPTYGLGQAAGQDGWQGKAWDTSENLEDSAISATGPLAGSQSLVYTQQQTLDETQVPPVLVDPGFGSGGFDDINRGPWWPDLAPATDGGAAIDLTATWLMKAETGVNGIDFGLYVSDPDTATGGASPFGMRIKDNTIQYLVAGSADPPGPWATTSKRYVAGDVWEFKLDVELDGRQSQLFGRNITAGETDLTSLSPGLVPVWDEGLPLGKEVYVGLAMRGGIGTVDNIQIDVNGLVEVVPEPGTLVLLLLAAPVGMGLGRRRR